MNESSSSKASQSTIIDISNLCLTFETQTEPVHALSDINMQVDSGDFVSLIGPSGCGKTTLLRVIADLEKPTSGSITVEGKTPHQARLDRSYGMYFKRQVYCLGVILRKIYTYPLRCRVIQNLNKKIFLISIYH